MNALIGMMNKGGHSRLRCSVSQYVVDNGQKAKRDDLDRSRYWPDLALVDDYCVD